ncbi:MAG: CRTAC1 family protein [Bdellovibrionota bacterium]
MTPKSFYSILIVAALTHPALADPKNAEHLLKDLNKKTAPVFKPLAQYPENFGGKSKRLGVGEKEAYSHIATQLAILDESTFQDPLHQVFYPLREMLASRKVDMARISDAAAGFSWKSKEDVQTRAVGGVTETEWKTSSGVEPVAVASRTLSEYVSQFASIDDTEVSAYSLSTPLSDRDSANAAPTSFLVEARLDIRGKDNAGLRRNDRGIVQITVSKVGTPATWKIKSFKLLSGETLVSSDVSFAKSEVFANEKPSVYLRKEAIRRGGYALAANDFDGDGLLDMIVGHRGSMEIFKGQKDGSFKKISPKSLGFEDETLVKSAVIADFDNDRLKDVLLTRFAPNEQKGKDVILYRNNGQRFVKMQSFKNRYPTSYAMPAAVADYNEDGRLDFYVGFPGAKDFTVLNRKGAGFTGVNEINPHGLFYNLGDFSFHEVAKNKFPCEVKSGECSKPYPEAAVVFPHAAMGIDYDLDLHMDIVVIDDKANLSPLYKNTGHGEFTQVADKIGLTNYDFGMGFAAADLDGDGKLEFIYTNVNFSASARLNSSLVNNFSEYSQYPGSYGLRIFKASKDGTQYSDVTALSGIKWAGEGLAGVEVIDYNNDGYPDIYVANGLWSGNSREEDLGSLFARANATENFDFQEVLGTVTGIQKANTNFMKILADFQGSVQTATWKPGVHPSMAGYQRNRLFRNNGNGTFTELGYLAGVDSVADGYMISVADLNHDGAMDLVLRNADPGTQARSYEPVETFINKNSDSNKSVILSFISKKSNRDGIGVIAEATIDGKKQLRHLIANNGAVQSETALQFGLGKKDFIDELKIRWPSGMTEIHKNIAAGRHVIEESLGPKTIAVR